MRVAYLVNRYPSPSHTFIRREIAAIEARGAVVRRFSVRAAHADLPDAADEAERARTTAILAQGALALLWSATVLTVARPRAAIAAGAVALRMQRRGGGVLRHMAYFVEACWLVRMLKRDAIDHLHAHFGTNPAAVARIARTLGGPPYSFTIHGPDEFDRPAELDLAGKIADAALVVTISSFGKSQAMRWSAPQHWAKIAVVRCGVSPDFLTADGSPSPEAAAPTFCCVARLSGQKGLPVLIDAAVLLRRRVADFRIIVIGDGELRPLLEQRIRDNDLGDHFTLLGVCDSDRVRREMTVARVFVLPSFAEGLPVVLMEAMGLGKPVIATAIAGIPELVDETCGWLVSAGSPEQLAQAMQAALEADPGVLAEMGQTGRLRVAGAHDAAANGQMLLDRINAVHVGA